MFKNENCEQEMYSTMLESLNNNQIENKFNLNKISKVIDLLNKSAEIFDKHNLSSDLIIKIINNISNL